MAATNSEVHTYLRLATDGKLQWLYPCFRCQERKWIIYLVSRGRIYKMAAAKPEIHASQFVDKLNKMAERFHRAYVFTTTFRVRASEGS